MLSTCTVKATGIPAFSSFLASMTTAEAPQLWPNKNMRAPHLSFSAISPRVFPPKPGKNRGIGFFDLVVLEKSKIHLRGILLTQISD